MSNKTRSIVSTAISLAIVVFATIIYFYFRNRDTKGEKVYLDNVIYKEESTLSFTTDTRYENGKSYYCVWLEITNTLTETQTFTIKNPYFKTDKVSKVTFKTLEDNGFSIEPGKTEYYMLGCPYSDINDVKKCLLHFKLNKYYFNLHTCLESYENN